MNRRAFTKGILATVSSFALIDSLFASNAFNRNINPITERWAIELNEFCSDLKKGSLTAMEWQTKVEALYNRIELEDILKFIDFDKLIKGFELPDLGVNTKLVKFPRLSGLPERMVFIGLSSLVKTMHFSARL